MNSTQQQLTTIIEKVEALHQKVEVLTQQVADLLSLNPQGATADVLPLTSRSPRSQSEHRDVLEDSGRVEMGDAGAKPINQELQLQRLMAQLTAAYNRIAALEEQLLAQRLQ